MVMIWFGNVPIDFQKVEFPTAFVLYMLFQRSTKNLVAAPSDQVAHGYRTIAIVHKSTVYVISMTGTNSA
jgi:hypothetical protein